MGSDPDTAAYDRALSDATEPPHGSPRKGWLLAIDGENSGSGCMVEKRDQGPFRFRLLTVPSKNNAVDSILFEDSLRERRSGDAPSG